MLDPKCIAARRARIHASHTSSRPLSPDYELVGVAGEVAFAQEFGLEVDATARPGGDGGVDFTLPIGTVDVKTYRLPYNLLREAGKPHADILVLAAFDEAMPDEGFWLWDSKLLQTGGRAKVYFRIASPGFARNISAECLPPAPYRSSCPNAILPKTEQNASGIAPSLVSLVQFRGIKYFTTPST